MAGRVILFFLVGGGWAGLSLAPSHIFYLLNGHTVSPIFLSPFLPSPFLPSPLLFFSPTNTIILVIIIAVEKEGTVSR